MPDFPAFFRKPPLRLYSGVAWRMVAARFAPNVASMRGSFLHGARYNIARHFGVLYASLDAETTRLEMARYFTVPPLGGFVLARLKLRLSRVVDLTEPRTLRRLGVSRDDLVGGHTLTQSLGLCAWEAGVEALVAPSAADPELNNLAVFLDNQTPGWLISLDRVEKE